MDWLNNQIRKYETQSEQRKAVQSMLVKTLSDFDKMTEQQQKSETLTSVRQLKVCLASSLIGPIVVFTASSMMGIALFKRSGLTSGRAFGLSTLSSAAVAGWLASRQFDSCQTSFLQAKDAGGARGRVYLRDLSPAHPALIEHSVDDDLDLLQAAEVNQLIDEHQTK